MAKAGFIRARVDEGLKTKTEMRQRRPFDVRMPIPNKETRRALDEAHEGIGIISHNTVEDMFQGWDD